MNVQITRKETTMINDLSDIKRCKLAQEIEEKYEYLLTGIRILIWKMGMAASKKEADDLAYEILNETVATAIQIAERYEIEKSAHAWLMGIATNKIKEMRTKEYRRSKRMGIATETYRSIQQNSNRINSGHKETEQITEGEMIDYLVAHNNQTNLLGNKIHLNFDELISLVSPEDRFVLKLAFVDNLKGKDLAAILQTSTGVSLTVLICTRRSRPYTYQA